MAKIAIEKLAAAAEKEDGLEVLTETPATQLLLSDEYTVEGVRAKTKDGKYIDYKAKAVVLATGGMSTNKTLLAGYTSQDLDKTIAGARAKTVTATLWQSRPPTAARITLRSTPCSIT